MGIVYEAVHQRLRQRVAVKMLLSSLAKHEDLVERFEREARAAATIESPNVAKVIDVDFTLEGVPYMVIEFLEGHDLAAELDQKFQLPVTEAVGYVMTACAPIAQAHALGIIHRDLKPSNLFLAKKGDDRILKVLDFGIAKVLTDGPDAKNTSSMAGLGTPHYMSPEQIRRSSSVDGRSDIWALGVILYELLTGTVPFPDDAAAAIAAISADPIVPPRELRKDIPEGLEAVIMKALEKNRDKRYATARDLAAALAPFAGEEELVVATLTDSMPQRSAHDWSAFVPASAKTTPPEPVRTTGPPTPHPATPRPRVDHVTQPQTPIPEGRESAASMVTLPPAISSAAMKAAVLPNAQPPKRSFAIAFGAAALLVLVASAVTWRLATSSSSTSTSASTSAATAAARATTDPTPSATTSATQGENASVVDVLFDAPSASAAASAAPNASSKHAAPAVTAKLATSAAASAVPRVAATNPLML